MRVQVVLTGPPRVILGRAMIDLILPQNTCTLEGVMNALAVAEPRIASYLCTKNGLPAAPFRLLLEDRVLEPESRIPDGATITLLYAMAGGASAC